MEDNGRPSFQIGGGNRRLEIVSERGYCGYNSSHLHSAANLPWMLADSPTNEVVPSPWGFGNAEMKRRKQIARYKLYTVEGRVKASIRNDLRWIRNKCSEIIHGYYKCYVATAAQQWIKGA